MTIQPRARLVLPSLIFLLAAVLGPAAPAGDPPDSEINPSTGEIESVDANWNGTDWQIRHVVDRGPGAPLEVTLLSPSGKDDLAPRIAFDPAGKPAVGWWRKDTVDQVFVRLRDPLTQTWGVERRVGRQDEPGRFPEIVSDGTDFWVAYEIDSGGGHTDIAVARIIDDQEPFPERTILASTSWDGERDVLIHSEDGHLWVTWVNDASDVGWSEHDAASGAWSLAGYERYAEDGVGVARDRIRTQVLGN